MFDAVAYLAGLITGWALGALAAVLVLRSGDGWRDAMKGRTTLDRMRAAGIGTAQDKKD